MIGASGTLNLVDRQIVSILIEPIKTEFTLSDTEIGLLTGAAFAFCYAIAAFPMARLLDRGIRRSIFAACVALWSVCTMLSGLATSFTWLLLARIGVAVGESSAAPAQHSLTADLYPGPRLPFAISIIVSCSAFGIAGSLFLGGWITELFGWRAAFFAVGAPGILLALLMLFFMPEPPRRSRSGAATVGTPPRFSEMVRYLWAMRSFRLILLGIIGSGFSGFALLAWGPSYLIRVFGMSPTEVGLWYGIATAAGYGIGSLLSGHVSTVLSRRSDRAPVLFAGAACLLAVPPFLVIASSTSAAVTIVCMFLYMFLNTMYIPPVSAAVLSLAKPRMRSTAQAITAFVQTIGGVGLGPLVLGILNDAFSADEGGDGMRQSLAIMSAGIIISGLAFVLAVRRIDADYAFAARQSE